MICKQLITAFCNANCCNKFGRCTKSSDNRTIIICSENKKKYQLNNDLKTQIVHYHIDGNVIDENQQKRCDYLLYFPNERLVILIELKGKDYRSAVIQIMETLHLYETNFKNCKICARIICGGVPNIQNDPIVLKLKKFLFLHQGTLSTKTNVCEEILSQIINV